MIDDSSPNAAAGLGARLHLGQHPSVVVVDLANAFSRGDHPLGTDLTATVTATARVLAIARRVGLPIIFVTIAFREDLSDAGIWLQKAPLLVDLITGTPLVAIDERLDRRSDELVIEKQGTSAFFGTELAAVLASQGVDTIVLCGASTSGCIRATAVDSVQLGLPCIIPRECVGDRSAAAHEANLRDLDAKYADVVSIADAIRYISHVAAREASTPSGRDRE